MNFAKLSIYALVVLSMATPTSVLAWHWWDDDDEEEEEIPFEEAFLFFELNDTDGDLGIHGKIDGDAWKKLEIENPRGRRMLRVKLQGRLKRQGLTELFFESAEPTFGELDPVDFFKRFPEGIYEIEGKTLDGEERENVVWLSHIIPAASVVLLNGAASASREVCGCDEDDLEEGEVCDPLPIPTPPVILSWDAVDSSHPDLGTSDVIFSTDIPTVEIDGVVHHVVRYYEVVVEIDETDFKSTSIVPPDVYSWEIPAAFLGLSDRIKYEVLVRTNVIGEDDMLVIGEIDGEEGPLPGNVTAIESCFEVI